MEKRTSRLTVLVDPDNKKTFEQLCHSEDVTPSQKIRQLMREYMESHLGTDWRKQVLNNPKKKIITTGIAAWFGRFFSEHADEVMWSVEMIKIV